MLLDRKIRVFTLADLLEYVPAGEGSIRADGLAWIGGDYNRLYLRLDGDQPVSGSGGEIAVDANYGRLVSPFWTALIGGRVETRRFAGQQRTTRGLFAVGLEGISPYWFEMEPTLYVSTRGQVSGRLATSLDLLFTQRLILQPRFETHFAVQRVPELAIGSGVNDVELGARLRYEIRREFAPYVGLVWFRRTGETAGLARGLGESDRESGIVLGVRLWH
jgi:copper resistance protein B